MTQAESDRLGGLKKAKKKLIKQKQAAEEIGLPEHSLSNLYAVRLHDRIFRNSPERHQNGIYVTISGIRSPNGHLQPCGAVPAPESTVSGKHSAGGTVPQGRAAGTRRRDRARRGRDRRDRARRTAPGIP